MGCLFGYCGYYEPGLLEGMAEILNHRCTNGWEKVSLETGRDFTVEIGHGIQPWSTETHVANKPEIHTAMGYSGLIFNHRLPCNKESSTSEKLLPWLADEPEKNLESLEGAFTGVLACGKTLRLIRDSAGVKVIYWTQHKDRFVFASEIKALFADSRVSRTMRTEALPEYLTFSYVPGERTMFKDIYELQPGNILTYSNAHTSVRRYFKFENMEWDGRKHKSDKEYARHLRDDLESSVRECCGLTQTPPSVFLSGGIDSSAVLALAAREFPGIPLKTFSVHFGSKYANENEFVSMMTERYHTDHTWLEIRPAKFLKRIKDIIWKLDDPIGDPITVPNFLLAEAASKVSDIVLNGEGGDPCFGGPKNIAMLLAQIYGPLPGDGENTWLERNYLLSYRKCFSDLCRILTPDIIRGSGGEEALSAIITPFLKSGTPKSFLNKLMSINIRLKGANLILVKVDKMTSANAILALPPLFSKRIIENSMACPPHLKLEGNIEKHVLKKAVEDILPRSIVQRPKSGMMVPVRFWLRKEMRSYIKKVLSRKKLRESGFFNVDYVRKLMNYDKDEVHGNRFGLKLWMLMTFMLWHEQMVENKRV